MFWRADHSLNASGKLVSCLAKKAATRWPWSAYYILLWSSWIMSYWNDSCTNLELVTQQDLALAMLFKIAWLFCGICGMSRMNSQVYQPHRFLAQKTKLMLPWCWERGALYNCMTIKTSRQLLSCYSIGLYNSIWTLMFRHLTTFVSARHHIMLADFLTCCHVLYDTDAKVLISHGMQSSYRLP